MERIPEIGGARGIFEIFVPGAFLLLNLATAAYLWPATSDPVREQLAHLNSNTSLFLLASITLGYLLGLVLRLLRSEIPDRLSAWFLRRTASHSYRKVTNRNRYAHERFPFTQCMKTICKTRMPPGVLQFYNTVWGPRDSKHFFNLCKLIVASEDPKAAQEIYAAEALCRHISGMFYALVVSSVAMISLSTAIWYYQGSPSLLIVFLTMGYMVAIIIILSNFRFMRLKEVETVFAASYRNRDKIEGSLKTSTTKVTAP